MAIGEAVAKLVAYSRVRSAMVTATAAFLATYYLASSHYGAAGSGRPNEQRWHLAASRMGDPGFGPETSWRFLERGMKSYATLEPGAWREDERP